MKKEFVVLVLIIIILLNPSVFAQKQVDAQSVITIEASCEMSSAVLSNLIQNIARNEYIIVISRLGNKEKKKFGQRRLNNVEITLTKGSTNDSFNRNKDSFVVAEGKKVEGQGFLDFYVKGKLELRILFNKNRDLIVSPCVFTPEEKPCSTDYEKLLYPCKK